MVKKNKVVSWKIIKHPSFGQTHSHTHTQTQNENIHHKQKKKRGKNNMPLLTHETQKLHP